MQYRSIPASPRISVLSARLWDLLALVFGTASSSLLITWQQQMISHSNSGFGLDVLLLLPFVIFCYAVAILMGTVWQRFVYPRAQDQQSDQRPQRPIIFLQLWRNFLLIMLLLHIIWVLVPVSWSGLRCVENDCTSVVTIPVHSIFPAEMRSIVTLGLWFAIYGLILPLGSSLAIRLCITPRWLGLRTTIYWIGCGILLNIALILTFPLSSWLGTWYE